MDGIIGYHRDATLKDSCNIANIVSNVTVRGDYNAVGLIVELNYKNKTM